MSAHFFVSDLEPGSVKATYRIESSRLRQTARGDNYLDMVLADKSGSIRAKVWQATEDMATSVPEGAFIDVNARVELYREQTQMVIEGFKPVDAESVDLSLYRAVAPIDPDEEIASIRELLESMEDPHLRALADLYLEDEHFYECLYTWPAAKAHHHPYLNGLLEHVNSVMKLGAAMCAHYEWLDRDLVLLGLFLHDSGKIIELVRDPAPGYSVEGELLGHITIGICMLHEMAGKLEDFPPHRLLQLKHIILSHHESAEYGSPKPPMFAEAQIVHTIEMMDAKINAFMRESEAKAERSDAMGSLRRSGLLRRNLYAPPESADADEE